MYTEPMIQRFLGHVPTFSKQKFSSNVMEKVGSRIHSPEGERMEVTDSLQSLRSAKPALRQQLIEEILNPNELGRMVRDPYANYVIQTAVSGLYRIIIESICTAVKTG